MKNQSGLFISFPGVTNIISVIRAEQDDKDIAILKPKNHLLFYILDNQKAYDFLHG
jgi:hypothetical protein